VSGIFRKENEAGPRGDKKCKEGVPRRVRKKKGKRKICLICGGEKLEAIHSAVWGKRGISVEKMKATLISESQRTKWSANNDKEKKALGGIRRKWEARRLTGQRSSRKKKEKGKVYAGDPGRRCGRHSGGKSVGSL